MFIIILLIVILLPIIFPQFVEKVPILGPALNGLIGSLLMIVGVTFGVLGARTLGQGIKYGE